MRYRTFIFVSLIVLSPLAAFADCVQTGVSSMSGVDNGTVTSGSITDLDDLDTGTKVGILSSGTMHFWWTKDMGSAVAVTSAQILQWSETIEADAGFKVMYSSSPLSTSNEGTQCGSSVSSTQNPSYQDSTFTCSATARYWGMERVGGFDTVTIDAGSFDIYGSDCGGGGGGGGGSTTTTATSTAALNRSEELFVIMVFIVLLGVPFWRFLFSWRKNE